MNDIIRIFKETYSHMVARTEDPKITRWKKTNYCMQKSLRKKKISTKIEEKIKRKPSGVRTNMYLNYSFKFPNVMNKIKLFGSPYRVF